jgi:uncharacterized membrane protein
VRRAAERPAALIARGCAESRRGDGMSTGPSTREVVADGHRRPDLSRLRSWVLPVPTFQPLDPALMEHAKQRAEYWQNRAADRITAFAGSMAFVYLHIIWFGCWIGFGVESYPYGLLTMIVSLEAIFLSTFVMISQNRAEAKRQVIADEQWKTVLEEDRQNKELLKLSQQQERENRKLIGLSDEILTLTKEVRALAGKADDHNQQNEELLDLSKRTFALTEELHRGTR